MDLNKIKLNFISNFTADSIGGGWDGINKMLFKYLSTKLDCQYIGPVNPAVFRIQKVKSKILRTFFSNGDFYFFSDKRLNLIAELVSRTDFQGPVFYFGATPWVRVKNYSPYYTYLDVCFYDYVKLFSSIESFSKKDIQRICELESDFLSNAKHIFWGSSWSKTRAEEVYNRKFSSSTVISTGGVIEFPEQVTSPYERFELRKILFISTNFKAKGGDVAFQAVKKLNDLGLKFSLEIVGKEPPEAFLEFDFVSYHGYLDKTESIDLAKLQSLYSNSFLLVHPTSMDTMGAVIAEAGYFGLPCIAPNSFGIPDLIIDNQTGLLIKTPIEVDEVVEKILQCVNSKESYIKLVDDVLYYMRDQRSWQSISNIITKIINEDFNS
jgi:glycosyltransferase involved in cell wall biosynthesis